MHEPLATKLLARASELDAAAVGRSSVSELRAAALEAGISPAAFDEALAEMHSVRPRRRRLRYAALALLALLAASTVVILQRSVAISSVASAGQIVEEALPLRCLSPADAAALIRPLLGKRSSVVFTVTGASRVITVRATPEEMLEAKSTLDQQESAATACPRG